MVSSGSDIKMASPGKQSVEGGEESSRDSSLREEVDVGGVVKPRLVWNWGGMERREGRNGKGRSPLGTAIWVGAILLAVCMPERRGVAREGRVFLEHGECLPYGYLLNIHLLWCTIV